jgi:peptidoglycan/xylan/chitin deacetylase (PgdA/CDA1 family)
MEETPLDGGMRVPVLMYHRVGVATGLWEERYCVSPSRFAEHMDALRSAGWQPCSPAAMLSWLDSRDTLPERSVLITFDDGFRGVHEHALPVLASRGWPFAVFVVSGLVGKHDEWSVSEHPQSRTYPLLDWSHLRELLRHGVTVGSHSRLHRDLTLLNEDALGRDLADSRTELEDGLGCPVGELAYPYGRHDQRVIAAARSAGYAAAFSVRAGFNDRQANRFQIRRLDVYGTDSASALLRKLRLGTNDGRVTSLVRYYFRRAGARLGLQTA